MIEIFELGLRDLALAVFLQAFQNLRIINSSTIWVYLQLSHEMMMLYRATQYQ